jgi:predicted TIM-barrel fold metal-dependent hydrolase
VAAHQSDEGRLFMATRGGTIDADGHVVEDLHEFAELGWSAQPTGDPMVDYVLTQSDEMKRVGLCVEATPWDADARVRDMEREGIEVSVNYPTTLLLVNQMSSTAASSLCRVYNDWAFKKFTGPTGERVRTMALVPLADPDVARRETRRAVGELGAPGIMVSPYCGHRHLDDETLEPLWTLVEELGVAVGIHGGRGTTPPLLSMSAFRDQQRYYAMAHPFGQMMAVGDLAMGGVLARHPRLRVVFLESGIGWVRWYVDRLDEGWESVQGGPADAAPAIDRPPSDYVFAGNCYFSCEPDEPGLEQHIELVGADRVVFASDYPHFDCKFPHSVDAIADAGLSDAVLRKVTIANATRLYAL